MARKSSRSRERRDNQKRYKSWRDVLAEETWKRCKGCGNWLKHQGDMRGKTCRLCGSPME